MSLSTFTPTKNYGDGIPLTKAIMDAFVDPLTTFINTNIAAAILNTVGGDYFNLSIQRATTTTANDSVKITGSDGTPLSSSNTAFVILPDPANPGRTIKFTITADITIKISGATYGMTANTTAAFLRVGFVNDNGTLRTFVAYQGNRTTLITTDTTATQTSATNPESVLCDTAVSSTTNSTKELGYVIADFTQSTAVWAVEGAVNSVMTGRSPDGLWQVYHPTITGYSVLPSGNDFLFTFTQIGGTIILKTRCGIATGTSNLTTMTMTLPIKNTGNDPNIPDQALRGRDNGTQSVNPCLAEFSQGIALCTLYKDLTGASWTNANGKGFAGTLTYQAYP